MYVHTYACVQSARDQSHFARHLPLAAPRSTDSSAAALLSRKFVNNARRISFCSPAKNLPGIPPSDNATARLCTPYTCAARLIGRHDTCVAEKQWIKRGLKILLAGAKLEVTTASRSGGREIRDCSRRRRIFAECKFMSLLLRASVRSGVRIENRTGN